MIETTVGQFLVNDALPESLRDYGRTLDSSGLKKLLEEVARREPDQYRDVSFKLNQIGQRAAQDEGGMSFGMRHLRKSKYAAEDRQRVQEKLNRILSDDSLTDKAREELIIRAVGTDSESVMKSVLDEAVKSGNPLGRQVLSGTRGKPMNLASLLGSDRLYADHHDRTIPIPVLRSYSEGLSPEEYWAGTYGARRGIIGVKFATADAGFASKQLAQAMHRLLVSDEDRDEDPDDVDPPVRGMPIDTSDMDSEGALLATDVGPFKKNTVLTPKILKYLNRNGHERILIRSPIIGGSPSGGVYARDVGVRETSKLPGRGEFVGLQAAQAIGEPLSQGTLSSKHSGGVAGQEKTLGGFQAINQLLQIPRVMKGGATHVTVDGVVQHVEPAPAGGFNVIVDGQKHYVGVDNTPVVKRGDTVEAGDVVSDGIPNPAEIVKYKGIGEGRKYFVSAMRDTLKASGINTNRRNIELLARGLINHVRLTEETDDNVPDDVVPYSMLEHTYRPRQDRQVLKPADAVGQYLERPVLHYTIGTKVRPSMLKDMEAFGVTNLTVHKDPPPFEAEMIRSLYTTKNDPDWMTQMYGSGLKGSLLNSTARGASSDLAGSSFVPSLALGVGFGRTPGREVVKPQPGYDIPDVSLPDLDSLDADIMPKPSQGLPKIAAMYHGSTVSGLDSILPNISHAVDGESVVYGTPDRDSAVSFAAPWSDDDFEHGVSDDLPYMREKYKDAFKAKFEDRSGSLYSVPASGFIADARLLPNERVSVDPVSVLGEERIANLLQELRKTKYRLIQHEDSEKLAAVVVPSSNKDFTVGIAALAEQRKRVQTDASKSQLDAGNYRKGHVTINGLDISIENPKGSYRSGTDRHGKAWRTLMRHDYGYIKRTLGKDGDHVDVFLGPHLDSELVFVVDQDNNGNGIFDEHKCMIGFKNQKDAKAAYLANYQSDWKGFNAITPMTFDAFKVWCRSSDTNKPAAKSTTKKADNGTTASQKSTPAYGMSDNVSPATSESEVGLQPPNIAAGPTMPRPAAATTTAQPQGSAPPVTAAQADVDLKQQQNAAMGRNQMPTIAQQQASYGTKSRFSEPLHAIKSQVAGQFASAANEYLPGIGGLMTMGTVASPDDMGKLLGFGRIRQPNQLGQAGSGNIATQRAEEPRAAISAAAPAQSALPVASEQQQEMQNEPASSTPTLNRNNITDTNNMIGRSVAGKAIVNQGVNKLVPKPPVPSAPGNSMWQTLKNPRSWGSGIKNQGKMLLEAARNPRSWWNGIKTVGKQLGHIEGWLPGVSTAGRAMGAEAGGLGVGTAVAGGALPALGGFVAVNAATELADAAGMLPQWAGGTGVAVPKAWGGSGTDAFGWDQKSFDRDTMSGGYRPISNGVEAIMNPLKGLQSIETGKQEAIKAVAEGARDLVTGTDAKSRAADADAEIVRQQEAGKQQQLQSELARLETPDPTTPPETQQQRAAELEAQIADSISRAEAMTDESANWNTGKGWFGGTKYRDAVQKSHDGLTPVIAEMKARYENGDLPRAELDRLSRLEQRQRNNKSLLDLHDREVGYTGSGNFDDAVRNRLAMKKTHLVDLQRRMREPAVAADPQLMASLQADMQATSEELNEYRTWAKAAE